MKTIKLFTLLAVLICTTTSWAQTRTTVTNENELRTAVQTNNAQIQFANDISTSSLLEIKNSRTITIDMNGFTLDRGCTSRGSQVIVVRTGSTLNLSNGTLTGGWGGNGGALDIETGTTVNLTDVIVTGNYADDRGGGISNSGTLTMTDCVLSDNTSRDNVENIGGGGLFNYANCTATLTNVTISGNEATTAKPTTSSPTSSPMMSSWWTARQRCAMATMNAHGTVKTRRSCILYSISPNR